MTISEIFKQYAETRTISKAPVIVILGMSYYKNFLEEEYRPSGYERESDELYFTTNFSYTLDDVLAGRLKCFVFTNGEWMPSLPIISYLTERNGDDSQD